MRIIYKRTDGIAHEIRVGPPDYQLQVGELETESEEFPTRQQLSDPAAWDAMLNPTQDQKAVRAVDGMEKFIFQVIFQKENDIRRLRALINTLIPGSFTAAQASQVDGAQFRQGLINYWKQLNP